VIFKEEVVPKKPISPMVGWIALIDFHSIENNLLG
jgi:hypothetical protein